VVPDRETIRLRNDGGGVFGEGDLRPNGGIQKSAEYDLARNGRFRSATPAAKGGEAHEAWTGGYSGTWNGPRRPAGAWGSGARRGATWNRHSDPTKTPVTWPLIRGKLTAIQACISGGGRVANPFGAGVSTTRSANQGEATGVAQPAFLLKGEIYEFSEMHKMWTRTMSWLRGLV